MEPQDTVLLVKTLLQTDDKRGLSVDIEILDVIFAMLPF